MFKPFPGFENLSFQVEVEYQGRKRVVVARMAQIPDAPELGTLVCSFVDSPPNCEWVLERRLATVYSIGKPSKYLDSGSEQPTFHPHHTQRLMNHVERAFRRWTMSNVHVVELPELPIPSIVLLSRYGGYWCYSWSKQGRSMPFAAPEFSLDVTGDTISHWLRQQWLEENSDVRFAWKWSQWSDEERIALIISFRRDAKEIKQVMRWILLSSAVPIDDGVKIRWVLNWQLPVGGCLYRYYTIKHEASELLMKWQKWLWRYFFDNQRINETDENVSAPDKRKYEDIVQVEFNEVPSAHERLEARLQLRCWLQGKATPNETKHLLDE